MSAAPHVNLDAPEADAEPAATNPPRADTAATGAQRDARKAYRRHLPQQSWIQEKFDKIEAFVSRLSMRDNFWNSICSLIWLPLAFFSGLKLKQLDTDRFAAYLPFRRFNRNWYRAMAGGALLANSEIAGGSYVFGMCGANYTVVCKNLNYTFMRPCFGPAVYHITPRENIKALLESGDEFNITIDMEVLQQAGRMGERDKRVGRCEAIFHVTPKMQHKIKAARKR